MKYTNQELNNYVSRVKLTAEKKASYADQIDTLKDNVLKAVRGMDNASVVAVKRAGSWKKGTALAPKGDRPLDIDMVFFLNVEETTWFDAERLRKTVIDVLCDAYPNKPESDFTDGHKTIGVVFRGSGLEVDIVPFIPDKGNTTYGRQPHKKLNSGEFRTSVDKQLQFTSDVKGRFPAFAPVVRILKTWRNYNELELSSFSIELVVAHLVCARRIDSSTPINMAVILCFAFLGEGNPVQVYFPGAIGEKDGTAPWIADPTNNENNTVNFAGGKWNEVVQAALKGFETITHANAVRETGNTLNLWKEVFGPNFSIRGE